MRSARYLSIILFLSCLVICLSAPSLWANILVGPTTPITILTNEEILSEFNPTSGFTLGLDIAPATIEIGVFSENDWANDTTQPEYSWVNDRGPVAVSDLPDTTSGLGLDITPVKIEIGELSKYPWMNDTTQPEAETKSNVESAVKPRRTPFALEEGPASEAYKKAVHQALWVIGTYNKMLNAEEKAKKAAEKLGKALEDAMDAEPGSEEARKAGERVSDAAKEAQETAQDAEDAKKEYEKAEEEYKKASEEYKKATNKAYEEAEKQNEAAQEAAEKAYEATGHGNKK